MQSKLSIMARYSEKKKPLKPKDYAGVSNAWVSPEGKLYQCAYMSHNEWAHDYIQYNLCGGDLQKAMNKIHEIHEHSLSAYGYTALHKLGWVRILTWSRDTKLLGEGAKLPMSKKML